MAARELRARVLRRLRFQYSAARFVPEVESATDQALAIVLDVEASPYECVSILVIGPQREAVGLDPVIHRGTTRARTG
ncbi:MAG TPA: hypothetical protein VIL10_03420, partial [Marmoricola sp.]